MRRLWIASVVALGAASAFGLSAISAARRPAPPPPVLCGCACPDGSFVITHAPDAASCPSVCAVACQGSETS